MQRWLNRAIDQSSGNHTVRLEFAPGADYRVGALDGKTVLKIEKTKSALRSVTMKHLVWIFGSRRFTDGWISFYWGKTIPEYEKDKDLKGAIIAQWLRYFRRNSPVN